MTDYLTTSEYAQRHGVERDTVLSYLKRFPAWRAAYAVKPGRDWLIDSDAPLPSGKPGWKAGRARK